jgi:hypothetical protein
VLRDVLHGKVLSFENTAAVQPCTCHTGRLEAGIQPVVIRRRPGSIVGDR